MCSYPLPCPLKWAGTSKRFRRSEHALAVDRERRKELLMREGYEEMAEHDAQLLKEFEFIDSETPLPEYAEN